MLSELMTRMRKMRMTEPEDIAVSFANGSAKGKTGQ
jgi:hypothetical protein